MQKFVGKSTYLFLYNPYVFKIYFSCNLGAYPLLGYMAIACVHFLEKERDKVLSLSLSSISL